MTRAVPLAVLLATLTLLAVIGTAHASETCTFTNVTPADTDPVMTGALEAADAYWARMGLPQRGPVRLFVYDDMDPDPNGCADLGGDRIWITRRARQSADLWGPGSPSGEDPRQRRVFLVAFCGTMTHEDGHTRGLTHESGWPIMRPGDRATPRECYDWAWTVAPDKPKARVARHGRRWLRSSFRPASR